MAGIRLRSAWPASSASRARASATASSDRAARTPASRLRWASSTSGPMVRIGSWPSSLPPVNPFTPTMTIRSADTLRWKR